MPHHLFPVSLGLAAQKDVHGGIAFPVKRGEEEDEHAQHESATKQLEIRLVAHLGEKSLTERHGTHEIKAHQTAEHAQQNTRGNPFQAPRVSQGEGKERVITHQDVGNASGGDAGYQKPPRKTSNCVPAIWSAWWKWRKARE